MNAVTKGVQQGVVAKSKRTKSTAPVPHRHPSPSEESELSYVTSELESSNDHDELDEEEEEEEEVVALGDMPEGRLLALMAQEVRASVHTYVQPLLLIHLPGRND